jgi:hypothetical protein
MYESLNTGSIDAFMDDEPVVKYAILQGKSLQHRLNLKKSGNTDLLLKKAQILNCSPCSMLVSLSSKPTVNMTPS